MRPRVFPAEDLLARGDTDLMAFTASMRPRVFPAEDFKAKVRGLTDRWPLQ